MVDVVLFDLFDTLITESETRPAGAGAARLGPRLGLGLDSFRTEWIRRRQPIVTGRLTFADALVEIGATLGAVPDITTVEGLRQERVEVKARALAAISPEVIRLIDELLRRDKRIGVISNCIAEDVATWSSSALGSRVQHAVFSFEVGCAKPDAAIYLEALRRFDVRPEHALFVGDGMSDELAGATAVGLRAFRASWFVQRTPGGATAHPVLDEPRELLKSLIPP